MTDADSEPEPDALLGPTEALEFVSELVAASIRKDPGEVRVQLNRATSMLGLGSCVDDVLFPAMRQIGIHWQDGSLDIETERLTTETIRGWLEAAALRAPQPDSVAPVLLACGPADRHSIGLEALALVLRHQRRACRVLGPRTSIRTLTTAVRVNRPSGVVIVSHLRANRFGATQLLRTAAELDRPLFYAGAAFATGRLHHDLPGTYLGDNIQAAGAIILGGSQI